MIAQYEATADVNGVSKFGVYIINNKKTKDFYYVENGNLIDKKSSEIHNIKIERRIFIGR